MVDGQITREVGITIDPEKTKVKVDGKSIRQEIYKTYIAFYKPRGISSTMSDTDPDSLNPWISEMPGKGLFHVGRLDKESEGLLLITNDGDWGNKVTHPRYMIMKEYELDLERPLNAADVRRIHEGVKLEDGLFRADDCLPLGGSKLRIRIHDGRNRILRRVFETLGYQVLTLRRTGIGDLRLGKLKPGQWKGIDPKLL